MTFRHPNNLFIRSSALFEVNSELPSNYISMINNCIAEKGATYIRGLTEVYYKYTNIPYVSIAIITVQMIVRYLSYRHLTIIYLFVTSWLV